MNTKVISVRIPFEQYEEILIEIGVRNINMSEWIILQYALVKNYEKKIATIKNLIENCPYPHAKRRICYILRDSPSSF